MKIVPLDRAVLDRILFAINASEAGPTALEIADAPRLVAWSPATTSQGYPVLAGLVSGHPTLGSDIIATSRLIAINPQAGWARTFSRWYALQEMDINRTAVFATAMGVLPASDLAALSSMLSSYIREVRRIEAAFPVKAGR